MKILSRFYFIILFAFFVSNSAEAQKMIAKSVFELNGTINGNASGDKVFLSYSNSDNTQIIDSTQVINNKFVFKGFINYPTKAYISNNNKFRLDNISSAQIYLEPQKMNANFDLYDFKTLKLEGSKTYNEYQQLQRCKNINLTRLDSIVRLKNAISSQYNLEKDSLSKNKLKKNILDLDQLIKTHIENEIEIEMDFIKQNTTSFVPLDLLLFRLRRREGIALYKRIDSLYNILSPNVQASTHGKLLKQSLTNFKHSGVGSMAPVFTAKDSNDQTIRLADFKNQKYILIDFWASWCAPCRDDFPFLKEVYSKYHEKGFEIISISTDKDLALWKKAIIKDNVSMFKHIAVQDNKNSNPATTLSSIEDDYFVTSIPVKVLINKDGLIVGRWRGGGSQNKDEIKKLLSEIFENKSKSQP